MAQFAVLIPASTSGCSEGRAALVLKFLQAMPEPFDPRPIEPDALKRAFEAALPFRHIVIDDFFTDADALKLHRAFPRFSKIEEFKARLFAGRVYGPPPTSQGSVFSAAYKALARPEFTLRLSEISGITPLAMDETHDGAGAHVGLRGSTLAVHADHNTHPKAPWLFRRINVLVYLNPNWSPAWRSNLLLYDAKGSTKALEIEPRFNRAIIMDVHDEAFHGYHSLVVPSGQGRQLLALYFYSTQRSVRQSSEPHGTILGNPADVPSVVRFLSRAQRTALHYLRKLTPAPRWADDESKNSVKVHY